MPGCGFHRDLVQRRLGQHVVLLMVEAADDGGQALELGISQELDEGEEGVRVEVAKRRTGQDQGSGRLIQSIQWTLHRSGV